MVDLHSHFLPGIDDGPANWEDAVQMVKIAAADGVRHVVATPHCNAKYSYDRKACEGLLQELKQKSNSAVEFSLGCDFSFSFENIEAFLQKPSGFCIGQTPYVLVEFSDFGIPPTTLTTLTRLIERGIHPIVTHPERNPLLQGNRKLLRTMVELGCIIQVTANSLTGFWGVQAEKACFSLLKEGMVSVVASDAHDTVHRPPKLSEARNILKKRLSDQLAEALCSSNPAAILKGKRPSELQRFR